MELVYNPMQNLNLEKGENMFRNYRVSRATRFTLFATGLMTVLMVLMYLILLAEVSTYVRGLGVYVGVDTFAQPYHLLVFAVAVVMAFTVSSIIVESVLNPLRQMITKIHEIGEMNFGNPLAIDDDDDELREYVFAFNTMAAKLNRYIEMQKRFVSDASHELATPITVINGHADMLLRRAAAAAAAQPLFADDICVVPHVRLEAGDGLRSGENDELFRSSLTIIKEEILRMSGLVDSLLLLARSDSGGQSYEFRPTDITALVQEVAEEIRLIAPEFAIETDLPAPITARCDEYAIRRVMRILLSNAIKYTENSQEGRIKITATESHGIVKITVQDNGIGIPKQHLSRIFERFYRVDLSRSRKTGSSGLGLAIAKEIISAHGGEISATSNEAPRGERSRPQVNEPIVSVSKPDANLFMVGTAIIFTISS
ncbi:MAG: ATP-binding protein [Defluviitaleaceae bacterium]|nr:ATP-binding protein [Defluviitaleaceae bacterium]